MIGAALWLNQIALGPWVLALGVLLLILMLTGWFATVINESESGVYNEQVDHSFRWGMSWFIFSEVVFFGVFFGALFYARQWIVPWLAGEGDNFFTNVMLWPGFENSWPTAGPARDSVERMGAWGIPALNTAILLTSGVTITIAHHMLLASRRSPLIFWLAATFVLGFVFIGLAGGGIHPRLHRARPAARYGHLRRDFFHVDRVPRPARHARRNHARGHLVAGAARAFHAAAPLCIRGGCLVLALRRRRLARPVLFRLLALSDA